MQLRPWVKKEKFQNFSLRAIICMRFQKELCLKIKTCTLVRKISDYSPGWTSDFYTWCISRTWLGASEYRELDPLLRDSVFREATSRVIERECPPFYISSPFCIIIWLGLPETLDKITRSNIAVLEMKE